ncbi:MAG: DNA topoisomerase I [Candidatus Woesearchaeota archaeon]
MPYELIITEKPNAAFKIAQALSGGKPIKKNKDKIPYYELSHGNRDIVVACAAGHLYTVAEKEKSFKYPSFDVEWKPTAEVDKSAAFSKKYLTAIKSLKKDADEFTVATDYDVEGEVIGLNVIKFACGKKDANRMKFSTLTKPDILKAYETKNKTLNWGAANAGVTRHILDWYYGINLSRALTLAIKNAGRYATLSIGRVQGPSLKIIVEKEKDITAFKPEPYWELELIALLKGQEISAFHEKGIFKDEKDCAETEKRVKDSDGKVQSTEKKETTQPPPPPFDLTTLQTEAYRCFGINPKTTLDIAQALYLDGLISYPRTSSQQLPKEIGYKKIIESLSSFENYKESCEKLLSGKSLKPNNGKKTDPAHPAIYPTGIKPEKLNPYEQKIFDLIAKRFLSTFGEPAKRESTTIRIDIKGEIFVAKGSRTIEKGWFETYAPFIKLEEQTMPDTKKGDSVKNKNVKKHDKETKPPKRYTPASIIKELEKKNLGTKSTRAGIVETLFMREYATPNPIEATAFGIQAIKILEKYSPEIIDEKLTAHFESEMDEIRENSKTTEEIVNEAREFLTKTLSSFKKKEKEIGSELLESLKEYQAKINTIGTCPSCKDGTLVVKKGKFGRFIACSKYPDCTLTFKLPAIGKIKPVDEPCEKCNHPLIHISIKKKSQKLCINPECPSKKIENKEAMKKAEDIASGNTKKACPKCGKDMVLRTSVYGKFYGCSGYPKCRHTENLE